MMIILLALLKLMKYWEILIQEEPMTVWIQHSMMIYHQKI